MTTDTAPRPEKVAIVEEITEKLNNSVSVFVTEYRGMSVGALANLRTPLREAGAEHKVYKNTLARLAATNAGYESLTEHLTGPTALTFVTGDSVAAAKALADLAKTNPLLVIRGGVLGTSPMSADDVKALASLPSREELLARTRRSVPGTAGQDRRSAPGSAPELRLRPVRPHREAGIRTGRHRRLTPISPPFPKLSLDPSRWRTIQPPISGSTRTNTHRTKATRRTPTWHFQPKTTSSRPSAT